MLSDQNQLSWGVSALLSTTPTCKWRWLVVTECRSLCATMSVTSRLVTPWCFSELWQIVCSSVYVSVPACVSFSLAESVSLSISLWAQRADFGQTELAQTKSPWQIDIYCYRSSHKHTHSCASVRSSLRLNACVQVDDFRTGRLRRFWSSWSTPVDRCGSMLIIVNDNPLSDTNLRTIHCLVIFGDSPYLGYDWQLIVA